MAKILNVSIKTNVDGIKMWLYLHMWMIVYVSIKINVNNKCEWQKAIYAYVNGTNCVYQNKFDCQQWPIMLNMLYISEHNQFG